MPRFKKKRAQRDAYEAAKPSFQAEPLRPLNDRQARYLKLLFREDQVFVTGPAGSGKTHLAAAVGAELLKAGKIKKIILCRPTVGVDEDLGFLPGNIQSKIAPWAIPFLENIEKRIGKTELRRCMNDGVIEIVPLAYARGRTFENAFLVLDEAQNCSVGQIRMILTRMGNNSKIVVNGDCSQQDLKGDGGLKEALDVIREQSLPIAVIEFTKDDVVRSAICAMWAEAWEKYDDKRRN